MTRKSRRQIDVQRSLRIRRVLDTSKDLVTAPICREMGCLGPSALVMDLVIEAKFLGVVSLLSFPGKTFTKAHEKLITQLNEPFTIAVTNSIHYREIQMYKELLEDDNQYLHTELRALAVKKLLGLNLG